MKVLQFGDPILKKVSVPVTVEDILDARYASLIKKMEDVLNGIKNISNENGNAIAAPQLGESIRLTLLRIDGRFIPMFNPSFKPLSDEIIRLPEECFSFYNIRATIKRFNNIEVSFVNDKGQKQHIQISGEMAAIIQHEIDHLDGHIFLERVDDETAIESIEYTYRDNPQKLAKVNHIIEYILD